MSDSLKPSADILTAPRNKPEKVFFASARPTKEKPRPDSKAAGTLDAVADRLQALDALDNAKLKEFAQHVEHQQANLDSKTRTAVQDNLSLLKREMDTLETIEAADILATTDSPWGALVQEIAESDRLKQSMPDATKREQYVGKLLFPFGAQLFREIRSMTTDPLTSELMFHSILDGVRNNPDTVKLAQASLPHPKDTKPVKHPMRRMSLALLGTKLNGHESDSQIDTMYKKDIHTAVLKSRLSAEQPLFDIALTEHMLKQATEEALTSVMPFAKEDAARVVRETKTGLDEMKRIRNVIDSELLSVRDEHSLMRALDKVQSTRFEDSDVIAPYKFESWVPESVGKSARNELEKLTRPNEDLYAKGLKKLAAAERKFSSKPGSWSEQKYTDHMSWLADPLAQATRKQRIINIIDLTMTIATLVSGVTGGIQRTIEGGPPSPMTITDAVNQIEQQRPWEVAADLASPKIPKLKPVERL